MSRSSVLVALVVVCAACNALVGYDNLEKIPADPGRSSGGGGGGGGSGGGGDDDDDDDTTSDAGGTTSSSGGADASVTGRCDPAKPFGTPVRVDAFDGWSARLSIDELEAFWVGPQNSLHSAKRTSRDGPWASGGTILMNPKFLLLQSITQNGNKIYYIPDNSDLVTRSSTRADKNSAWNPGVKVDEPGTSDNIFYADGDDIVYLDAFKSGTSGERNLFTATLSGGVISTSFQPIPVTDQAGVTEWHPVVNSSQTNLYFLRGDDPNARVFRAHRATKGAAWEAPTAEPILDGADGDAPSWVSEDDCVIYLDRDTISFMAVRPK